MLTQYRTEDIPFHEKKRKTTVNQKFFIKKNSVFKDWKEDQQKTLEECLDHDVRHWRVGKFIKDIFEQDKVQDIVHDNYELLKTLEIYYASKCDFPYINDLGFDEFLNDFKLMDGNLTKAKKKINFDSATNKQV